MGHRMEVYVPQERVPEVISMATSFGIDAQQIGRTEAATTTRLTLTTPDGKSFEYS